MRLGMTKEPTFAVEYLPEPRRARRALRASVRDATRARIGWYDVFARWKLAIVLEGSYAKFQRGHSDKPIHEFFGTQVDLLVGDRNRCRRPGTM